MTKFILDLPDGLHHKIKIRSAIKKKSMKDFIIECIKKNVCKEEK